MSEPKVKPSDTVTITRDVWDHMQKQFGYFERRSCMLAALEDGGVDNWEWYSESLREAGFFDDEDEEGEDDE